LKQALNPWQAWPQYVGLHGYQAVAPLKCWLGTVPPRVTYAAADRCEIVLSPLASDRSVACLAEVV
jgi:hypothetical protein